MSYSYKGFWMKVGEYPNILIFNRYKDGEVRRLRLQLSLKYDSNVISREF